MRRLKSLLNVSVPLYFVVSVFVLAAAGLVASLGAMAYAEREGHSPVFTALGSGVRAFGHGTYDLFRAVYETGRQVDEEVHTDLIAPLTFPLADDLAPAQGPGFDLGALEVRASPKAVPGWRIVVGMFDLEGERVHAALALDSDMIVRHVWRLHEQDLDIEVEDPFYKFPHGFELWPDGSIVFAFDHGNSLRRFDACGGELWSRLGHYHHAITRDPDRRSLWTLRSGPPRDPGADGIDVHADWIVEVADDDGRTLRAFTLSDVIHANPEIDILGIRQFDLHERAHPEWLHDPFHINDVEPLPAALAANFPGFEAGDLLLSLRSLNLVLAVDPDTLRVRWYRIGFARRQHDPDWMPDGRLLVFDNNMNRGASRIVALDPQTFDLEVLVDGAAYAFHTGIRGKQQRLPDGSLLIASPMQGRVFEVGPDGSLVFELVNVRDADRLDVVVVSEARWLPADWFDFDSFPDCSTVMAER